MQNVNASLAYKELLEILKDDINRSIYTQEGLAQKYLYIRRETLCRKLNSGNLTGQELFILLMLFGRIVCRR